MVLQINGEKLLVQIGDGASPEVFTHDCLINTERGIAFSNSLSESINPDCDTPENPAWIDREKDSLSATVSGSGTLHTTSTETWFDWFKSPDPKNIRVLVDVTGANGGGYWSGAFHLTSFEITGTRKEKATVSVSMASDGALTWTDAA